MSKLFAKLSLIALITTALVNPVLASHTEGVEETLNDQELVDYLVHPDQTWWDYFNYIIYSDEFDEDSLEETTGVEIVEFGDEEAISRMTNERCILTHCFSWKTGGILYEYFIEDNVAYLRTLADIDMDDQVAISFENQYGEIDYTNMTLLGYDYDYYSGEYFCEIDFLKGAYYVENYFGDVLQWTCTFEITSNSGEESFQFTQRTLYMEHVGLIHTEMAYYNDREWQYTFYSSLHDTSLNVDKLAVEQVYDYEDDNDGKDLAISEDDLKDEIEEYEEEHELDEIIEEEHKEDEYREPYEESPFSDLKIYDRNFDALVYLYDENIVNGYSDGTVRLDEGINRAELIKLLVEAEIGTPDAPDEDCFTDVSADEWYAPYICEAKDRGWIDGNPDGSFRPADLVNKAEAIKMLLNSQEVSLLAYLGEAPFEDTSVDDWYTIYIASAEDLGLLEDTGSHFYPGDDIQRGNIFESLYRLLMLEL